MKLKIRNLEEKDWEILPNWWDGWKWTTPNRDALPQNGLGGFMVYKGDQCILAGFVYTTNSKGAWVEWIISDPKYRGSDRQEALELFIKSAENWLTLFNYKYILFIGRHKNLINTFKKLGWSADESPSYELMKKI